MEGTLEREAFSEIGVVRDGETRLKAGPFGVNWLFGKLV